ncbi:PLDc N-terminal domain-containing protein [Microbacterium sp.]|uniref:PLDc N-terminal domain-containing protein n=1 Tax=Microbacterium sp. TaxID=51671 RepID=UPI0037C86CBB
MVFLQSVETAVASGAAVFLAVLWFVLAVALLVLWLIALISIGRSTATAVEKGVWSIVVLISPIIGAIAWLAIGRRAVAFPQRGAAGV